MVPYSRVFVAMSEGQSYSAARSVVEVTADSTHALVLMEAWIENEDSETSNQLGVRLLRKTVAGTGSSVTPLNRRETGANDFGGTARHNMTAEGTASDVLHRGGFNVLNGRHELPIPEGEFVIPPSGIIALELMTAPLAATIFSAGLVFGVVGNPT